MAAAIKLPDMGLLKAAIRDDNPVLLIEHKLLYGSKGARAESGGVDASSDIPDEDYVVPLGKGVVRREGNDVTIVATLLMMHRALQAAERLEQKGISAEVIDPRSLVPFDWDLVNASVMKTTRAAIVEEGPRQVGWGAEIAATLSDTLSDYLTAPVRRVASPNTPVPFSPLWRTFTGRTRSASGALSGSGWISLSAKTLHLQPLEPCPLPYNYRNVITDRSRVIELRLRFLLAGVHTSW